MGRPGSQERRHKRFVNRRNYYRILHVQPDAATEVIEASYRVLMRRLHPDRGGSSWQAALLNEARAVLTDPSRRAAYDRELRHDVRAWRRDGGETPGRDRNRSDYGNRAAGQEREARSRASVDEAGKRKQQSAPYGLNKHRCPFCGYMHLNAVGPFKEDFCARCLSPLHPVIRRHVRWNRLLPRIPFRQDIRFFTSWPQAVPCYGVTCDLSPHGMQFYSGQKLVPYQVIKIEGDGFQAIARVRYCISGMFCGKTGCRVGVEFLTVSFPEGRGRLFSARI